MFCGYILQGKIMCSQYLWFCKNSKLTYLQRSWRFLGIAADQISFLVLRVSVAPGVKAPAWPLLKASVSIVLSGNASCLSERFKHKLAGCSHTREAVCKLIACQPLPKIHPEVGPRAGIPVNHFHSPWYSPLNQKRLS